MEILRLEQAQFSSAYEIFCAFFPKQGDRDALYPTFCRIPPGGKTTSHAHFETEFFYIISGDALMIIKDEVEKVYAGDLIHLPSLSEHELKNNGAEELIFLSVYSEDFETTNLFTSTIITSAPPTPNGPLHLGHISGPYLASDILTRYLRLRSTDVHQLSGTDDHQNYIFEKSNLLQIPVDVFRQQMRARIQKGFNILHIEFDEFIEPKIDSNYKNKILEFAQRAINSDVIKLETLELPYCKPCDLTLIDALIEGNCPHCNKPSHGSCENCGIVVPPQNLQNAKCSRCKNFADQKLVSVYTFALSDYLPAILPDLSKLSLSARLRNLIENIAQLPNYKIIVTHPDASGQGLHLPEAGQALHVWFEMAAHYEQFALQKEQWIHCFGFDNSFYYLLFIPALLRAMNAQTKLPDAVITNDFLLLDELKFSTSREHAIWVDEFAGNADHLRLFLSLNRPSSQATNFSLQNFKDFSADLRTNLQELQQRALVVAQHNQGKILPQKLIDCNRFTRDMEQCLSPKQFDLRRASRHLLTFMDLTMQAIGSGCTERLMLQVLGMLMTPFMPNEAENLLAAFGENSRVWLKDWTRAA